MTRSSATGGCSRGSSRNWATAGGSAIPQYDTALREQRIAAVTEAEKRGLDAVRELAASAVDARIVGACLAEVAGDKYRTGLVAMIPATAPADEWLAEGWLARRFQQDGWTWLDRLLAEELIPEQAAVALLASRDYPKAWQVADTRGAPVAEAFWRYFSISGLGHGFSHAVEAAGRLAQAGRVAAALKLAVIYIDDLGGQSADFLIGLLSQFASIVQVRSRNRACHRVRLPVGIRVPESARGPGAQRRSRAAGMGVSHGTWVRATRSAAVRDARGRSGLLREGHGGRVAGVRCGTR